MTIRNARRVGVLGLAVAGLVLSGVSPAQAIPEEAVASASIGSVSATFDGDSVDVAPLASCATDEGVGVGSSGAYAVRGFLEFGRGSSTCSLDDDTGVASTEVSGKLFRLDSLRSYGGPRIRMTNYSAECSTTENGSSASFHIGGLSGISVPNQLPPNYVKTIPGAGPGAPPLARITLNETIAPDPPDGSMTVNMMHIHLFPDSGQAADMSGEILVGSVTCSPY